MGYKQLFLWNKAGGDSL